MEIARRPLSWFPACSSSICAASRGRGCWPLSTATALAQPALGIEERKRPVEIADRDEMRHHVAEACPVKPGMKMEGRRLDPHSGRISLVQIERDGMVGRRANRCGNA